MMTKRTGANITGQNNGKGPLSCPGPTGRLLSAGLSKFGPAWQRESNATGMSGSV